MFDVFEHTADVGLIVEAETPEGLLVDAVRGLTSLLTPDADRIEPRETVAWTVASDEWPLLLFDHLTEALYLFETRRLLIGELTVTLAGGRADVTATGERLDPARHRYGQEVKAITYHELTMEPRVDAGGPGMAHWHGRVIVDI